VMSALLSDGCAVLCAQTAAFCDERADASNHGPTEVPLKLASVIFVDYVVMRKAGLPDRSPEDWDRRGKRVSGEGSMMGDSSGGVPGDHRAVEGEIIGFGEKMLKGGHVEEALKFFKRMVRVFPESPAICACLGEAYLAKGDSERAQTSFGRSRERDAKNDEFESKADDHGGAR
jgi:hypothetical protein